MTSATVNDLATAIMWEFLLITSTFLFGAPGWAIWIFAWILWWVLIATNWIKYYGRGEHEPIG